MRHIFPINFLSWYSGLNDIGDWTDVDIYSFMNSRDVASHLKSINYSFSAYEMAYIVYMSEGRTLAEKLDALRGIVQSVPDCEVPYRVSERVTDSTHDLIKRYIDLVERRLASFPESDEEYFRLQYKDQEGGWNTDEIFRAYEECMAYLQQEIEEEDAEVESSHNIELGNAFRMEKCEFCNKESENRGTRTWLLLNRKLEPLDITTDDYGDDECELMLDNGHIQIPVSFRRGDLVVDVTNDKKKPFVFTYLAFWDSKELEERGTIIKDEARRVKLDERMKRYNDNHVWDASHMVAMGYINDHWMPGFSDPCMIWEDEFGAANNYLNLEYYREELAGASRVLGVVSKAEKKELDVEGIINTVLYIASDSVAKGIGQDIRKWYSDKIKALIDDEVNV